MAKTSTVSDIDLADYVGALTDDYIGDCVDVADAMVTTFLAGSQLIDEDGEPQDIPEEVVDRAVLEVGSELYHRKNAPNGVAQFATMDAPPIRIARDPMVAARPILAPYLRGGFA